ncbi:hypothetical protein AB0B50_02765 [Streptomyces sp. NPDC041068]|uniref:hypothetical protein n=1 Tax=Streptomyces sp. NPDC041068 TaxID=3155130 RepID=UPI0033D2FB6C
MGAGPDAVERFAELWQAPAPALRWAIWLVESEAVVFDRDINCPVPIGDGATFAEVLRRMRAAGVPDCDEYPGRPCS